MKLNHDSPVEIQALLSERGLGLKKRWGQNFLVNRGAREKLVGLLHPGKDETVWEIGPGLGSMTELLLPSAGRVVAFEIDRGLCLWLSERFQDEKRFILVEGDFLKTWRKALEEHGEPSAVLGNLPYSCASAIIAALIEGGVRPGRMILTVQKELADRMTAEPGTRNWSSFSLLCRWAFRMSSCGSLMPGSFYPVPEVVSAVVEAVPVERNDEVDTEILFPLIRSLFNARRKTLRNNLLSSPIAKKLGKSAVLDAVDRAHLEPGIRGEELPLEDVMRLAQEIARAKGSSAP